MRVQTFLPLFPGFYGTLFQADTDSFEEYESQEQDRPITYEDYDFDNAGYEAEVGRSCCHAVLQYLSGAGVASDVEFERINSPREYNFTNDNIDCTITIDPRRVIEYVTQHYEAFTTYIKEHFTSRSGFISFYSNDPAMWLGKMQNDISDLNSTEIGSVLDFITRHWLDESEFIKPEDQTMHLYYDTFTGNGEDASSFCTLKSESESE